MGNENHSKITLGVSSCLLGENVRFDSGHKKDLYVTNVLADFFSFRPFCPEVSIGLSVPREPIHLISKAGDIHCVGIQTPALDVTRKLKGAAENAKDWHQEISGYILKSKSPSCGMEKIKVYHSDNVVPDGVGIYAQRLMDNFPYLPVEEEVRLNDSKLRENFIQRVYVYHRWKKLNSQTVTLLNLQRFHTEHQYIFMSHAPSLVTQLDALLSEKKDLSMEVRLICYQNKMTFLLKKIATSENHVNTLLHILSNLENKLGSDDKKELVELIENYAQGVLPLIAPAKLLRHHFIRQTDRDIENDYYLAPCPGELKLLNRSL